MSAAESAVDEFDIADVPTFDDVLTGEVPVHSSRVRATPVVPDPMPVGDAVAFGVVPQLVPRRHLRRDRLPVTVRRIVFGVAAAVAGELALVLGILAGLESLGGAR